MFPFDEPTLARLVKQVWKHHCSEPVMKVKFNSTGCYSSRDLIMSCARSPGPGGCAPLFALISVLRMVWCVLGSNFSSDGVADMSHLANFSACLSNEAKSLKTRVKTWNNKQTQTYIVLWKFAVNFRRRPKFMYLNTVQETFWLKKCHFVVTAVFQGYTLVYFGNFEQICWKLLM